MLFCHITSRVEDDPHQGLLREKGGSGFPYVAFLNAEGDVIAKPRGRSVDAFHETLEGDVAQWVELSDKAATGDPDASTALFLKKVEFGHFADVEAARAEMAKHEGLSDEQRAEVEQRLVEQEFNDVLGTVRSIEGAAAGGKRALPMLEKGRIPKAGSSPMYFWLFIGKHAEAEKDAELLERAIEGLGSVRRAPERLVKDLRKALEKIKKG